MTALEQPTATDEFTSYEDMPLGRDTVGDILRFYGFPVDFGNMLSYCTERFVEKKFGAWELEGMPRKPLYTALTIGVHEGFSTMAFHSDWDGLQSERESTLDRLLARIIAWHLYLDSK